MKILLDMGHCLNGADTGAQGNGRKEQDCTREIGYKVKAKLEALEHEVIICSCDSASSVRESLNYRCNKANSNGGYIYVSIHLNAGGGLGVEVYTYGAKHFAEAENVLNNIVALGFRNRGIKDGSNLAVIRGTKMKAMLVECCFIDSDDMQKYNAENFANAIVNGLVGQTSNSKPSTPVAVQKPTPKPQAKKTWEINISGDIIRRLQTELNNQFSARLVVDAYCGDNTMAKLITVRKGARGNITKIIQELLIRKGYSVGKYGADSVFGNGTYDAVCAIQRDNGLTVDGVVGINTWKALLRK